MLSKPNSKFKSSIKAQLVISNCFIFLLTFIFLALVIVCTNYFITQNREKQVMQAYLKNGISSIDNKLKDMARVSLMAYSDAVTQDLVQNYETLSQSQIDEKTTHLHHLYHSLITIRDDVESVYIFSNQALVFNHSKYNSSIKSDYDMIEFINWIRQQENAFSNTSSNYRFSLHERPPFLWSLQTKDSFDSNCLYVIREIRSFSPNEVIGHILLISPISTIKGTLEEFLDSNSTYFLLGEGGTIMCTQNGQLLGQNFSEVNPELHQKLSVPSGVYTSNIFGEKCMISWEKSAYSSMSLITAKPVRYVYQNVLTFLFIVFITSVAVTTIALILTASSIGKIIKPIQSLSQKMCSFSKENTHVELPVTSTDEVGQLTQSFNQMICTINDLIFERYESELQLRKAQLKQKESQLLYLRQQINPHFLYNTLDNIRIKAAINGDNEVADMIMRLVEFFRRSMEVDQHTVTLDHEIALITVYLELMKYRYPNIEAAYEIEPSLRDIQIPSFILQPIVENSLLHGLKAMGYKGKITLSVTRVKGSYKDILICITDNGKGIDEITKRKLNNASNKRKNKHSIGVRNVQQRLQMYYPDGYGLSYYDNPDGGTIAVIKIKQQMEKSI